MDHARNFAKIDLLNKGLLLLDDNDVQSISTGELCGTASGFEFELDPSNGKINYSYSYKPFEPLSFVKVDIKFNMEGESWKTN